MIDHIFLGIFTNIFSINNSNKYYHEYNKPINGGAYGAYACNYWTCLSDFFSIYGGYNGSTSIDIRVTIHLMAIYILCLDRNTAHGIRRNNTFLMNVKDKLKKH